MSHDDRTPGVEETTATPASLRRSGPSHASSRRAWRHAAAVGGAAVALTLGLGSGAAWAYFAASGTGTGQGAVGKIQPLTLPLPATGAPGSALFPGGSADLHLYVTNPNTSPVDITGLAINGTVIVKGGNGCSATNATLSVTSTALDIKVTPGTSSVTVPTGISMGVASFTGCQSATFSVPLTVTVRS
ncbi:MAG: hypothetical protein ACRDV8_13625 [Acidimicrobiales bacterium]